MQNTTQKTRPCKPGDILASRTVPCGAKWEIAVLDPDPHPSSGVATESPSVKLELRVRVPNQLDCLIRPDLRSEKAVVLGENLRFNWGYSGKINAFRQKERVESTQNIAATVAKLSAEGAEAVASVQAVSDAHEASKATREAGLQAICAGWPVLA